MSNALNLTGQRFGKLTVVKRVDDPRKGTWWLCKCDCGKTTIVNGSALKADKIKSCGCLLGKSPKTPNLTGQRFGRLTVIKRLPNNKHNQAMWLCRCDCGNTISVSTISLRAGNTTSCGCYQRERVIETNRADLIGQRFGRLTVIRYLRTNKHNQAMWLCRCDCGNTIEATTNVLTMENTTSCGCYGREQTVKTHTKHALSETAECRTLYGIIDRCYNSDSPHYKNYGARGIKVDERYLGEDGVENFIEDVGPKPSPDHSIERVGVNLDYVSENMKWAPKQNQPRNRRSNKISDFVEAFLIRDLYKLGHTVEDLSRCVGCSDRCIRDLVVYNRTWIPVKSIFTEDESNFIKDVYKSYQTKRCDYVLISSIATELTCLYHDVYDVVFDNIYYY